MRHVTRALAAAIPGARVHEIEGVGHAAAFDAPARFARHRGDHPPNLNPRHHQERAVTDRLTSDHR